MREPMTAAACAETIRSFLRHRERMSQREVTFINPDGSETVGRIDLDADELYHAMKFALTCVEEKT